MTNAAERLNISQPPLSRIIKRLEIEIGTILFERSPRGLALTPSGQFFHDHTLQILEKLELTVGATRRIGKSNCATLSIGFVPSVFYGQLPVLIKSIRQKDNVELSLLELTTVEQVQALKTGRIDIGFGRLQIDDPEIEQKMIYKEPLLAALTTGHPFEGVNPSLEELANYPLILFPAKPRPSFADYILGIFRRHGFKVKVAQETNELQTALGLVASGIGFTLVPDQVKRVQLRGVEYVELQDKNLTSNVYCIQRKGDSPTPIVRDANKIMAELLENRRRGLFP